MWRFGLASFVSRTASTMANDSAPIIGMWVLGPEAVAVYSVALTLTQNARRLQEMANAAVFPSVMRAGAVGDMPGLRRLYLSFMDISFAIGSLVYIALMVFSGSFLTLWVGSQFTVGALAVTVLAIGYLLQSVASTAPLVLQSQERIGITVKIGVGEALACIVLTAVLPGFFGMGLVGMALGSTLPRLASNLVLYPPLAVRVMGNELLADLPRAIGRNLALCLGVWVVFYSLHRFVPGGTWLTLGSTVAVACGLHLSLMAFCYEGLPVIGSVTDPLRRWVLRQPQP